MGWIRREFLKADVISGAQIADDSIDSEHYVDGSIDTAHIAADAIDGTLIADDSIDSEHYVDGSIDTAHIAADAIDGTLIADDAVDSEHLADDCVGKDAIADAAVGFSALTAGVLQREVGTIATGDVATMNATPVEVIAAPGAGAFIQVLSCHWFLDFNSVGYDAAAAGDTLELKYTNGAGAAVVDAVAGDAIGAAAADYHVLVQAVAEVIPVDNAAIVAHINTGEWYAAAGDSPLKYEIIYRIMDTDPVPA